MNKLNKLTKEINAALADPKVYQSRRIANVCDKSAMPPIRTVIA